MAWRQTHLQTIMTTMLSYIRGSEGTEEICVMTSPCPHRNTKLPQLRISMDHWLYIYHIRGQQSHVHHFRKCWKTILYGVACNNKTGAPTPQKSIQFMFLHGCQNKPTTQTKQLRLTDNRRSEFKKEAVQWESVSVKCRSPNSVDMIHMTNIIPNTGWTNRWRDNYVKSLLSTLLQNEIQYSKVQGFSAV